MYLKVYRYLWSLLIGQTLKYSQIQMIRKIQAEMCKANSVFFILLLKRSTRITIPVLHIFVFPSITPFNCGRSFELDVLILAVTSIWISYNCFITSPGCRSDPFSCGSLFGPKRDRGGWALHRGQAREAFTGAGNVPIHCWRGNQASSQGS